MSVDGDRGLSEAPPVSPVPFVSLDSPGSLADELSMNTDGNVTPLPSSGIADSWSAGPTSLLIHQGPDKRHRYKKITALGVVVALLVAGASYGGFRAGHSKGDQAGHERGLAEGYQSGHETGFSEGRTEGYASGHETGYADGETAGYATGYGAGKKAGFNSGWTAGCLAVFTTLGDDTAAAWNDVDGVFDSTFASTVNRLSCY